LDQLVFVLFLRLVVLVQRVSTSTGQLEADEDETEAFDVVAISVRALYEMTVNTDFEWFRLAGSFIDDCNGSLDRMARRGPRC
jgi:hypothetical protein